MSRYAAMAEVPWANGPEDELQGESFAADVDDLIDRLKTLPSFIDEAAYGNNLSNEKVREELQSQWRVALATHDAQLLFDTAYDMHDAYANELIFGSVEREREAESIASVWEARRILDLYRGVKA